MDYFDTFIRSAPLPSSLPEGLCGAVIIGEQSVMCAAELNRLRPGHWIAATDSASSARSVIDFAPIEPLVDILKRPALEWWTLPQTDLVVNLTLPPGAKIASGVRNLSGALPGVQFIADPFAHGPEDGWQAKVRMAERENIWLTTRGLWPANALWNDAAQIAEAFYFVSGEVGSGKLLFASGATVAKLDAADPRGWLGSIATLDDPQRELILAGNARELFHDIA